MLPETVDSNSLRLQTYLDKPLREHAPTLPQGRPLKGADLQIWRHTNQLSSDEMKFLLSLASSKWGELCNKNGNEVIPAEYEILIRVYDRFPDLMPLPPKVSAKDAMKDLEVGAKDLSLLAGRESTSGHRWVNYESGMSIDAQAPTPSTQRILLLMCAFSRHNNMKNVFINMVEDISEMRGLGKILTNGTWKSVDERRHGKIKRLITTSLKKLSPLHKQTGKIFAELSTAYEDGQIELETFDKATKLFNTECTNSYKPTEKYEQMLKLYAAEVSKSGSAELALPKDVLEQMNDEENCHFASMEWIELKEKEKQLNNELADARVRFTRLEKRLSKQPNDAKSKGAFDDVQNTIGSLENDLTELDRKVAELIDTIQKVRKL